jgi:hypothetical protein
MSLQTVAARMLGEGQTVLPIRLESGQALVITLADLNRIDRARWGATRVGDILDTRQPSKTVGADELISAVLPDIIQSPSGALPVKKEGTVIGVITAAELASLLQLKSLEEPALHEDKGEGAGGRRAA